MKISALGYSVKQSVKNMVKNRLLTVASISTIAACLFILGLFYTILTNFQYMVNHLEIGVTVFFRENITEEEIDFIESEIRLRPELKSIKYVSPDEAWEMFKEKLGDFPEVLLGFDDDNPLAHSASFEIYLDDVEKHNEFVRYVESIPGVRLVRRSDDVAEIIKGFNVLIAYVSIGIIIILLLVSVFLISNTVRIGVSMRKDEIKIMKLIGATDGFIRRPFIFEGIIIGLVGGAIPLGLIYLLYNNVIRYIEERFNILRDLLQFLEPSEIFNILVPVLLGIGIVIGIVGSRITLKKHLRV
ncbi:cell division protein FtsX [Natranaerovirga pectinivora]|uniref:Cell division protein FtsX n=2 Tax=Natranaerovirga pectinivora TaxID=682400 RepID=A0A4R3MMF0_9FIRM|nr:cell division protein FtsX [Natranaerovirga pectinivora]